MTKNLPVLLMLSLTVLFVVFTAGCLIGKSTNIQSPYAEDSTITSPIVNNDAPVLDYKININTAGADELMLLNGIGHALAERIIAYRTENGSFTKIDEIMNVSGIGQKTFENISEYITTGG